MDINLLRKIWIFTVLLSCPAPALSHYFYLGASTGLETADFNQNATIVLPGTFNTKDHTHFSGTGFFGSLFGGHAWTYGLYYLAGELNANASSVDFNSSNDELINNTVSTTHYRIRHSAGLSIIPGYYFTNNTLVYARLGYANGNFNISTSDTSIANINKYLNGIRLGLGIQLAINNRVSASMEYSQTNYQSTSFTQVDGTTTKHTDIAPTSGQFALGLVYRYNHTE